MLPLDIYSGNNTMPFDLLTLNAELGLPVVFGIVLLACLAVPVPASLVALVAGGLSASGELTFTSVVLVCFIAFVIGDQIAFALGKVAGKPILSRLQRSKVTGSLAKKAEHLVHVYGLTAVFLSRTIFSPTGPYVNYVCAVSRLAWLRFSTASVAGAVVWSTALASLGYVFAAHLPQLAALVGQFFGFAICAALIVGFVRLLSSNNSRAANTPEIA
jgi:membrane-associated protein